MALAIALAGEESTRWESDGDGDIAKRWRWVQEPVLSTEDGESVVREIVVAQDPLDSARREFSRWFSARGANERQTAEAALGALDDPRAVVRAAFAEYREKGNAERLAAAADFVTSYSDRVLPLFRELANFGGPDTEYFIEPLANLTYDNATAAAASEIFRVWLTSSAPNVRRRLATVSDALSEPLRGEILERLAKDAEEDVSATAQELLEN